MEVTKEFQAYKHLQYLCSDNMAAVGKFLKDAYLSQSTDKGNTDRILDDVGNLFGKVTEFNDSFLS